MWRLMSARIDRRCGSSAAQNHNAVGGDAVGKLDECRFQVVEILVRLEVLAIDVRDDGEARRKLQERTSLSSASATRYFPRPSLALLPKELTRPPMTAVGSRPRHRG